MANRTGNDHSQSAQDECEVRNGGSVTECATPAATRTVNESRDVRSHEEGNDKITSSERFKPASERQNSRHVTWTISEDHHGRHGRLQTLTFNTQQSDTPENYQPQSDASSDETTMTRKSRKEAELRVENEIIEAMKRERELR